jgi:ribonuclease D
VGESHLPALAQVATARAVYIFPLQRLDCSAVLAPMLQAAHIVKAGISLADDLKKLKQLVSFEEASILDLGQVAARHGLKQTGLRNLTGLLLGTRIPKGAKTTNWAVRRLSPQQITYAATDAWACRELYLKFEEMALL